MQLELVSDLSLVRGSYSFNTGFYMRFLSLTSASGYKESGWTDTSGNSKEVAGEWKIKDATVILLKKNRDEAFDVVRYKDLIFLVPIEERDKLATLINEVEKYEVILKRKGHTADSEDKWIMLLESNRIFSKNK